MCPGILRGVARAVLIGIFVLPVWADGHSSGVRLIDGAGQPVPGAVVYVDNENGRAGAPATATAIVDQVDKQFEPRLTVIQVGTEVEFPNNDVVSHHVYSFSRPNSFELPLYKGEDRPKVRFDHPGVITLGCNIHDSMIGYIVVVDSAEFGITNEQGVVELPAPPAPGTKFRVWTPDLGASGPLTAVLVSNRSDAVPEIRIGERVAPKRKAGGSSLLWDEY